MGSLFSSPKAPPPPAPIVMTMPQPAPPPAPAPLVDPDKERADAAAQQREDNLLRRSRGQMSTVMTGLGGVLNDRASLTGGSGKTLLGE